MSATSPTRRQVVEALTAKPVRAKAAQQIRSGVRVIPLDMGFPTRLNRSAAGTINFEVLTHASDGDYYKPVAFFKEDGGCLVLGEYWPSILELNEEGKLDFEVEALNKEANAVIAAFSADSLAVAKAGRETRYVSNGMSMEMFINHDGNPQVWADDRYGFDEAIAIYDFSNNMVNPTVRFKKMFDAMERRGLLSAFADMADTNLKPFDNPPVLDCGAFTMGGASEDFQREAMELLVATDDSDVERYLPSMKVTDPEKALDFITSTVMGFHSKQILPVFIKLKRPPATVGYILCWSPRAQTGVEGWSIEFMLAKIARGRGIMTAALNNVLANFQENGVKEVKAIVDPSNAKSIRILEKLRFQRIGDAVSEDGSSTKHLYSVRLN